MALTLQIKSSSFVKSAVNKREVKSASQMYRLDSYSYWSCCQTTPFERGWSGDYGAISQFTVLILGKSIKT